MRPASDRLPGHALALSLHKVWEVIQHQKDLNLPAHKVQPLTMLCPSDLSSWLLSGFDLEGVQV